MSISRLAITIALVCLMGTAANAAIKYWNTGSGAWDYSATNWSSGTFAPGDVGIWNSTYSSGPRAQYDVTMTVDAGGITAGGVSSGVNGYGGGLIFGGGDIAGTFDWNVMGGAWTTRWARDFSFTGNVNVSNNGVFLLNDAAASGFSHTVVIDATGGFVSGQDSTTDMSDVDIQVYGNMTLQNNTQLRYDTGKLMQDAQTGAVYNLAVDDLSLTIAALHYNPSSAERGMFNGVIDGAGKAFTLKAINGSSSYGCDINGPGNWDLDTLNFNDADTTNATIEVNAPNLANILNINDGNIDINAAQEVTGLSIYGTTYTAPGTYGGTGSGANYEIVELDGSTAMITLVPEPATIGLFSLGGLLAISRRRRA